MSMTRRATRSRTRKRRATSTASPARRIHVDECANQRYYQDQAWEFVREHPGEKAKLAAQAVRMEWDPAHDRLGDGLGPRSDP